MKLVKDILYGYVKLTDLALKFIDTPEFQRLRRIKQLSTTYLVFPSTSHSRFEHSVGVYHLTGEFLESLDSNIDNRLKEIIKLAGLLHDIGHLAFSHTFDHKIIPHLKNASYLGEHEDRSSKLIKHMIKKYNINVTEEEYQIIKHCIDGEYYKGYPKYLFQIVCNKYNGIDTDKMDYLQRDSYYFNQSSSFDISFIVQCSKVIDDEICFSEKLLIPIYKMFNLRYTLHKEIYQHNTAIIFEYMIRDHLLLNREQLKLDECHKDFKWVDITDDIIYRCEDRTILDRIDRRDLYKFSKVDVKNSTKVTKKISFNSIIDFYKNIYFYNNKDQVKYKLDKVPDTFPFKMSEEETLYLMK